MLRLVDDTFITEYVLFDVLIPARFVIKPLLFAENVEFVLRVVELLWYLLLHVKYARLRFRSLRLRQPVDLSMMPAQTFELGVFTRHPVAE